MSKMKLAIGLLSAATAATWGPYLLEPPTAPRHLGEDTEDSSEFDGPSTPLATTDEGSDDLARPAQDTQGDLVLSSRSFLEELRNLVPSERRGRLDQMATSWSTGASTEAETTREEAPVPQPVFPILEPVIEEEDSVVEAFLAENPLSAILFSDEESLALLGPYVVRTGQEVLPGLSLTAIEARAVTLDHEGHSLRLTLPPVRSRPTATEESPEEEEVVEPEPVEAEAPSVPIFEPAPASQGSDE